MDEYYHIPEGKLICMEENCAFRKPASHMDEYDHPPRNVALTPAQSPILDEKLILKNLSSPPVSPTSNMSRIVNHASRLKGNRVRHSPMAGSPLARSFTKP